MRAYAFEDLRIPPWQTYPGEVEAERTRRLRKWHARDLLTSRAQAALDRIGNEQRPIVEAKKRNREDWRAYGAALLGKRKDIGSAKKFGRWIKANKLDRAPADTPGIRSDAMWLAEHWEELQRFCFSEISKQEGLHRPSDIRTACRRAGYEWAGAKAKKDGAAKRTRPRPGAKAAKTTEAYRERSKKLDDWMNETEFKLVLGCLHPDRQPEDQRPRYQKAFRIFNRLKVHLNPDKYARMAHGWDIAPPSQVTRGPTTRKPGGHGAFGRHP